MQYKEKGGFLHVIMQKKIPFHIWPSLKVSRLNWRKIFFFVDFCVVVFNVFTVLFFNGFNLFFPCKNFNNVKLRFVGASIELCAVHKL